MNDPCRYIYRYPETAWAAWVVCVCIAAGAAVLAWEVWR